MFVSKKIAGSVLGLTIASTTALGTWTFYDPPDDGVTATHTADHPTAAGRDDSHRHGSGHAGHAHGGHETHGDRHDADHATHHQHDGDAQHRQGSHHEPTAAGLESARGQHG